MAGVFSSAPPACAQVGLNREFCVMFVTGGA
jgi:hypothetical protein